RFAVAAAAALTAAILSAWVPRVPASAAIGPGTPRGTPAQRWFGRAKPFCNPVEVAQFMARNAAVPGWDGTGYAAGCWALAGKIDEARSLLARVQERDRWRAAGIVFDLAHPVADAGDGVAAAAMRNLGLAARPCRARGCAAVRACSVSRPAPVRAPGDRSLQTWANGAVFYEVFVRSFQDSNGDGKGDLKGLISRLDYLNDGDPATATDLGVDALWLMPVCSSPSSHGYDPTDY